MKITKLWERILLSLIMLAAALTGLVRVGSAAESRFLVSYGGTAGYQLPLWVNKELGFSKKYGVDLEIILIQAGSPNIQALLGGSLQLTQTAASSSVIAAAARQDHRYQPLRRLQRRRGADGDQSLENGS